MECLALQQKLVFRIVSLFVFVSAVVFSNTAFAQFRTQSQGEWEFSGYFGGLTINSEVAGSEEALIDDSAIYFGVAVDYVQDIWILSASLDYLRYDDLDPFTQATSASGSDDVEVIESTADATVLGFALGPKWDDNDQGVLLYGQLGYSFVLGSERGIDFCTDCTEEEIDIEGGVFGKFGVIKSFSRVSFGAHYTRYFGDEGLENAFHVSVGTAF